MLLLGVGGKKGRILTQAREELPAPKSATNFGWARREVAVRTRRVPRGGSLLLASYLSALPVLKRQRASVRRLATTGSGSPLEPYRLRFLVAQLIINQQPDERIFIAPLVVGAFS